MGDPKNPWASVAEGQPYSRGVKSKVYSNRADSLVIAQVGLKIELQYYQLFL